jgi:hypothetical protein
MVNLYPCLPDDPNPELTSIDHEFLLDITFYCPESLELFTLQRF